MIILSKIFTRHVANKHRNHFPSGSFFGAKRLGAALRTTRCSHRRLLSWAYCMRLPTEAMRTYSLPTKNNNNKTIKQQHYGVKTFKKVGKRKDIKTTSQMDVNKFSRKAVCIQATPPLTKRENTFRVVLETNEKRLCSKTNGKRCTINEKAYFVPLCLCSCVCAKLVTTHSVSLHPARSQPYQFLRTKRFGKSHESDDRWKASKWSKQWRSGIDYWLIYRFLLRVNHPSEESHRPDHRRTGIRTSNHHRSANWYRSPEFAAMTTRRASV